MLHGKLVEKELQKGKLKTGGTVSIHFASKNYLAAIDFGEDEASLNERGDSPGTIGLQYTISSRAA